MPFPLRLRFWCAADQQYVSRSINQFDGELCLPCSSRGILTARLHALFRFRSRLELGNDRRTGIATTEALRDKQRG